MPVGGSSNKRYKECRRGDINLGVYRLHAFVYGSYRSCTIQESVYEIDLSFQLDTRTILEPENSRAWTRRGGRLENMLGQ